MRGIRINVFDPDRRRTDLTNPHTLGNHLPNWRRAWMKDDTVIFDVHPGLRISGNGLREGLNELWLPRPLMSVTCSELLKKIAPAYGGSAIEIVEAVREPDVDIQGDGAVFDLLDGGIPKRHGMTAELLEEVAIEEDSILEDALLPVVAVMEKTGPI
jgi:hypothetical protein